MEYHNENMPPDTENAFSKEIDIANRLADILLDALKDEKQFNRYLVKGKENTDEVVLGKVDIDSLNNAIKALKSLEEIKRAMNDTVTGGEENNDDKETGIVILPDIEEEENENK